MMAKDAEATQPSRRIRMKRERILSAALAEFPQGFPGARVDLIRAARQHQHDALPLFRRKEGPVQGCFAPENFRAPGMGGKSCPAILRNDCHCLDCLL